MSTHHPLKAAFARALSVAEECITDDLHYQHIPEWDSLGHLVLIEELERTFNITLQKEDILSLTSYSDAKRILQNYDIHFEHNPQYPMTHD